MVGLLLAVVMGMAGCGGGGSGGGGGATATADTPTGSDAAITAAVETAKATISAKMKDPASTTFRYLATYRIGSDNTVCGEVNAKNSFGAYVGYQAFYYRPSTSSLFQYVQQTPSTGSNSYLIDSATATLIRTVCSNITSAEASAAESAYIKTLLP